MEYQNEYWNNIMVTGVIDKVWNVILTICFHKSMLQ